MKDLRLVRAYALTVLAAVAAHVPALRDGFVLDDGDLLVDNPYVRGTAGLGKLLTSGLFDASARPVNVDYFRPMSSLLYWVSWHLFGASAPLQHALNVAMHAGVAALLLRLLLLLGARRAVALGCATAFAVHPATGDIVAYIGGRQDMLGWILALATLGSLVRRTSPQSAALATFFGVACAMLARESFVFLAALAPIAAGHARDKRRVIASGVAAGLGVLAVVGLRAAVHIATVLPEKTSVGAWVRLGAAASVRLLGDAFAPIDLAVDVTIAPAPVAVVVAVVLGVALAAVALVRKSAPGARLGAVLGAAGVVLVLGVHAPVAVRTGELSDRYAYPLLVVLAIAFAAALETLARSLDGERSPLLRLAPLASIALAVVLAPATWARDAEWRDEESLQAAMYAARPSDPLSQYAEGMRLFAKDDCAHAYPLCLRYADAHPQSHRADFCVGACLVAQRRPKDAVPRLRAYLEERPNNAQARHLLLLALFASNDLDGVDAALAAWSPALDADPEIIAARAELARRRSGAPR